MLGLVKKPPTLGDISLFRLSRISLANRSVVALLTIIVAAFGFISLGSLKQELIPSFEVPQAAIVTAYPGASPEVVDNQISKPIEEGVRTLKGLVNSTSTSQSNLSVVRVEFDYGTKTAQVEEDLNNLLASLKESLPADVEPQVISGSFDSVPIIALSVASTSGENDKLAEILEGIAGPILSQVDGVRDVSVAGAKEKRVNLDLKEKVLRANGLSQQSIVTALQNNGFVLPAGTIEDKNGLISVEIGTAIESLKDFKNLPLIVQSVTTVLPPGAPAGTPPISFPSFKALKISEVATVTYEYAPITSISRTNGLDSLSISITKTQDGNTVSVSHGVQDLIPELIEKLGGDVEIVTVFDQAPFVEQSLENLTTEGLLGLTFAILIILLFLLSIRSTLVTAISIPTSVLITFIGLNFFGYSLNLFTLSALTIAIGRVVDDSIVVIENINRHLSYGEPKKQAIIDAVREVAGAITAATITTVAVFLPIALVSGLTGELFRPFSISFTIALVASLLVSLTIVPVLAYWFLKSPAAEDSTETEKAARARIDKARAKEEEKERKSILQRGYLPILKTTQAHPVVTLVAAVAILGFTFALVPQLKTNFIGDSGSDSFSVTQEMPAGTSFEQKDEAAAKLEKIIMDTEGVKVVTATFGGAADSRVAFGRGQSGTSIQVNTEEDLDQVALQADLLKRVSADSSLGEVSIAAGGGPGFGSSSTIDIKVSAPTDEALYAAIDKIEAGMANTKNVSEVTNSLAESQRTLKVTVDRVAAAKKGLTEIQISGIVSSLMRPSSIGTINIENQSTPLFVLRDDTPMSVKEIREIQIPSSTGLVDLSDLADIEEVTAPVSITSEKGERTAKVSLTPDGDDLGAITLEVTEKLDGIELPIGTSASIGGVSADQQESFEQLGLALLAAVAIVFLVMVATFSSLIQPLILLISIPFAATGALGLLLITDTALGVPALIGMLLLVGVVVTNAIVLIDLVNQYRKQGKTIKDSIMEGSRQRLRPILMTALATIFALTPMALGITGGGGFISQPLAVVVIGGLFSSTLLTLIIVPVLYWLVEGRKERRALKGKTSKKKSSKKTSRTRRVLSKA